MIHMTGVSFYIHHMNDMWDPHTHDWFMCYVVRDHDSFMYRPYSYVICTYIADNCGAWGSTGSVRHDSSMRARWGTLMSHVPDSYVTHSYVCHDSFTREPWLIHMCDTHHSCVQGEAYWCVTGLIHVCAMPHSYVCHDPFTHEKWFIHTCDTSLSYVRGERHTDVPCSYVG